MTAELAPCLAVGRAEVNAAHPGRDLSSDGTIGDTRHAESGWPENGGSRHNVNSRNRIDAWDCDITGSPGNPINMARLIACWMRHPSAQNVIFNRKVRSRSWGWTARDYNGVNPHDKHGHFESQLNAAAETNRQAWGYYTGTKAIVVPVIAAAGRAAPKGGMSKLPTLRRNPAVKKAAVGQLQRALRKIGISIGVSGVDFSFGDATVAAVRTFQGRNRLPVDGVVGMATWTALAQALLGGIGVDGKFGAKTLARVIAYQKEHGLTADGVIGPRTWGSLIA